MLKSGRIVKERVKKLGMTLFMDGPKADVIPSLPCWRSPFFYDLRYRTALRELYNFIGRNGGT